MRGGGARGDTSSAPAGHLPLKGKADGGWSRADDPPLCECLTAGRAALFPGERKNFKKISKCRKRQTDCHVASLLAMTGVRFAAKGGRGRGRIAAKGKRLAAQ